MRILASGLLLVAMASAQQSAFDAATIKPHLMTDDIPSFRNDPARLAYTNVTLRDCMEKAWGLKGYQIELPKSVGQSRFDVTAAVTAPATAEQMMSLLRKLLTERFRMAVHTETRELPVYGLKVGNKPRLKPTASDAVEERAFAQGKFLFRHFSMDRFAEVLSDFSRRPVVDQTGLTGFFDISLEPQASADPTKPMLAGEMGDAIAAALEPQLGLRLESRKMPIKVLVVDRAEKSPTEN